MYHNNGTEGGSNDLKLNDLTLKRQDEKTVLLFNQRNLEIALLDKDKYEKHLQESDWRILEQLCMTEGKEPKQYRLSDSFPTHISKAYLLFGTDCNIDCKYCTVRYNAEKFYYRGSMSKETLTNSLRFLFEVNEGIEHITLYGGEPLLHMEQLQQFFAYLETLPKNKVPRIDLITNGTIINQKLLYSLNKWNVLVLVSLDGEEEVHDTFRIDKAGKGTYQKVVSGIQTYRDAGLRVGVSLVLGKHNYKKINEICIFLKSQYDIVSIGLTLPHMEPDVVLNDEFEEFLCSQYSQILDVCQQQQLWFEQGMKRLLALSEKTPYIYGCPATPQGCMIRILPDGTMTLCENMGLRNLYQLGNVSMQQLKMDDVINSEDFQKWYNRCTNGNIECQNCRGYAICGMGCPYDAYLQNGTIFSRERRGCAITRQAVDWYLARMLKTICISDITKIKIPNIKERKCVFVECPWN